MRVVTFACTVCDSPSGEQVRAVIFGADFGWNVLLVLAPFPLLFLAVLALHFLSPAAGESQ